MRVKAHIWAALTAAFVFLAADGVWTSLSITGVQPVHDRGFALTSQAAAQTPPAQTPPAEYAARKEGDDHVIGNPDAKVVVIEFASLTCPHCARFHIETLPKLKAAYIDTGLVKFIYRDFPLDRVALQAAQVARCMPAERYFSFLDVLFRQQEQWAAGRDPNAMVDRIKQLAAFAGLSRERATACLEDQALQLKIVGAAQNGEREYKISATPSLVINGKRHTGSIAFEEVDKVLREIVRKP
jgi:protein-disulfide isomerase